jgi:hypothetical protein
VVVVLEIIEVIIKEILDQLQQYLVQDRLALLQIMEAVAQQQDQMEQELLEDLVVEEDQIALLFLVVQQLLLDKVMLVEMEFQVEALPLAVEEVLVVQELLGALEDTVVLAYNFLQRSKIQYQQ